MSEIEFVWKGENIGTVEEVVISDTHVSNHIEGGEVKRLSREHVNLSPLLEQFHRDGIPVRWVDDA